MNHRKLSLLLDSVYELEGLIHLAMTRGDEAPGLATLIASKGAAVANAAAGLGGSAPAEVAPEAEMQMEESADEAEMDMEMDNALEMDGRMDPENQIPANEAIITSDDSGEPVESVASGILEPSEPSIDISEPEVPESSEVPEYEYEITDDEEEIPDNETQQTTMLNEALRQPVRRVGDACGRLVFSINDRFRFRRTLFDNSDQLFSTTLGDVAAMDTYEEAEDYFYARLQWEPDNEEVAAFMEIIRRYFES